MKPFFNARFFYIAFWLLFPTLLHAQVADEAGSAGLFHDLTLGVCENVTVPILGTHGVSVDVTPTCSAVIGGILEDSWFNVRSNLTGSLAFSVTPDAARNIAIAVYDGASSSAILLNCANLYTSSDLSTETVLINTVAGNTYTVRLMNLTANELSDYSAKLSVYPGPVSPRDLCVNSVSVSMGTCNFTFNVEDSYIHNEANSTTIGGNTIFADGWLKIDLAQNKRVRVEYANTNKNASVQIYRGDCGNLTLVTETNAEAGFATSENLEFNATLAGTNTYFIRIGNLEDTESMAGEICIEEVIARDVCSDVQTHPASIALGDCGVRVTIFPTFSNADAISPCDVVNGTGNPNVWVKYTATANTRVRLEFSSEDGIPVGLAVSSGVACGSMSPISSSECLVASGSDSQALSFNVTNGTIYYIELGSSLVPFGITDPPIVGYLCLYEDAKSANDVYYSAYNFDATGADCNAQFNIPSSFEATGDRTAGLGFSNPMAGCGTTSFTDAWGAFQIANGALPTAGLLVEYDNNDGRNTTTAIDAALQVYKGGTLQTASSIDDNTCAIADLASTTINLNTVVPNLSVDQNNGTFTICTVANLDREKWVRYQHNIANATVRVSFKSSTTNNFVVAVYTSCIGGEVCGGKGISTNHTSGFSDLATITFSAVNGVEYFIRVACTGGGGGITGNLSVTNTNALTFMACTNTVVEGKESILLSGGSFTDNTQYYIRVARVTDPASGQKTVTGDLCIRPNIAPTATSATAVANTSFTANWTAVAGTSGYKIDVSTDPAFGSYVGTYNNLDVANVLTYNITGLTINTVYYYRVRAYSGTNSSGNSNVKMTTTAPFAGGANVYTFELNKYIQVPHQNSLNLTSTITFEAWLKPTNLTAGSGVIIAKNQSPAYDNVPFEVLLNSTGNIVARLNNVSANGGVSTTSTTPAQLNVWQHIAVTYDQTNLKIYFNGVLDATLPYALPLNTNTDDVFLGHNTSSLPLDFRGQIEEVRIWSTARTEAEIRTNMCQKLIGTETNILAYYRFDEPTTAITTTTTENKASTASIDAILVNSPTRTASTAPVGDVSTFSYGGTTATLTDTDAMSVNNMTGTPNGFHIYKVKTAPTNTTTPANYQNLYTSRYWGVFTTGGTTPTFDLSYNYTNNFTITNANALRFAKRTDANTAWNEEGGIVNRTNKILTRPISTVGEFILANRNPVYPAFRNGGVCLQFDGVNRYARLANFAQDDFTIEFWMRSNQTSVSGSDWEVGNRLVDASTAGIGDDFGTSILDDKLAFGVGGNTTTISNKIVKDNQWHHVAVTRTKATGTMTIIIDGDFDNSGVGSTNTLNASPFLYVASALGTGNFFQGEIDELRVWNTVLTPATVKDWMNLRANEQHPHFSNLITYYRFDENTGILSEDLVNGNDGDLFNGVVWATSTMPLGDGNYQRMVVNTGGAKDFINANLKITFPATGTYPNGELVVTRLDVFPDAFPAVAPANTRYTSCYWVVRNYGTNQTFSTLDEMEFTLTNNNTSSPLDVVSPTDWTTPSNITLYTREDNDISAGTWTVQATATAITAGPRVKVGGGNSVSDFSQFILGSATSPLPITLWSFTAERANEKEAVLRWITASEQNNQGFDIERSHNAQHFEKIAHKEGIGNSILLTEYIYMDKNASKDYYYRLKQIDYNGTFTYSSIVFVAGKAETLHIHPIPAQTTLNLVWDIDNTTEVTLKIYQTQGKSVWEYKGTVGKVQSEINKAFPHWKNGMYILKAYLPNKTIETKFIKNSQ